MPRALLALCLLLTATSARAEDVTGRVAGVYYQAAPGILLASSLQRGARGDRWADVELADGRRVLARVPDELPVSPGQRIAVRLGDSKSSALAQTLPTTAVTRALAPDPNASIGR